MAKRQMYAIGILQRENKIKYVTSIEEHRMARWDDGKEAMLFSKEMSTDMCQGFAWNGIAAIPILKLDWITLQNLESKEEEK